MIKPGYRYGNHPNDFVQEELNEHDKKMIEHAQSLHYTDWTEIHEEQAETIEGYERLHSICSRLYHKEEASIGNL